MRMRGKCVLLAWAAAVLCAAPAMAADDDFVMGNYTGTLSAGDDTHDIRAQVVALSDVRWRANVYVGVPGQSELMDQVTGKKRPGTGETPGAPDREKARRSIVAEFEGDLEFEGMGGFAFEGVIENETFTGTMKGSHGEGAFTMKRVFIEPPTRGMKAPEGAVVLLDGTSMDAWHVQPHWMLQGDGAIQIVGSNIVSKQEFGACTIHVEFMTPFMPHDRGQARGNSGVYVHGRYEVQVLDSFGEPPADNFCGGIYSKAVPLVNATLPPLQWQTYDIEFQPPQFDGDGNKTKDAVITVVHNGITIHDAAVLDGLTPGGVSGEESARGPLLFQDHGNAVRYRNVWVKEH